MSSIDAPLYPVGLVVRDRLCLVVGGGPVAARKAEGLARCGARVRVVATSVSDAVRAVDGVDIEERPYRDGEAAGYRLVITATGDAAVDQQVYDDAEASGVWVNAADDPARCTAVLPAVARRGPITVAVSTGGKSPALASWLRSCIEERLGPEYEALAGLLAEERAARQRVGQSTETLNWRSALDSDILDLIRNGQVHAARERLQACLSSSSD